MMTQGLDSNGELDLIWTGFGKDLLDVWLTDLDELDLDSQTKGDVNLGSQ